MKKILLGLLAVSAISFAAAPNYGAAVAEGTTIFQTGQSGKIAVTGAVTSTIPVVKYVIFASKDGVTADDTLALSTFTLSNDVNRNVFEDTNLKVYVKRVNGSNDGFVELSGTDIVEFSLERDGYNMNDQNIFQNGWIQAGGKLEMLPLALLSDAKVNEIVQQAKASAPELKVDGPFVYKELNATWQAYLQPNTIHFKHTTNGVLEIVADTRTIRQDYNPFEETENKAMETALAGSVASSGFSVLVRLR